MSRLSRRPPVKEPATIIIVVTEGKKTEPQYLEMFQKVHVPPSVKRSAFDLKIIPNGSDPTRVVDEAIQELEILQRVRGKKGSVWAMFDRDDHSRFEEAKNRARSKEVRLAVSNPCFEIWGIYHYQDWQAHIESDKCQNKLGQLCPSYDKNCDKSFTDKDAIKKKCYNAIERAKKSLNSREEEGDPEGNPSTSVHYLIEEILSKVEELTGTTENQENQAPETDADPRP